jgi:protein TonB
MHIKKHLIPALLAAVLHTALLTLIPAGGRAGRPPGLIEVPLFMPGPKPPVEDLSPPPQADPASEPVAKLAGGPALPSLDEPPPITKAEFTIAAEERIKGPVMELNHLPPGGALDGDGLAGIGRSERTIYLRGELDSVPRAKVQLPPDYPGAMRQSGVSGSVLVEFDVDREGRVTRAAAVRYTEREFVEPALRAVRKWRFEPGRRQGVAVAFRLVVPIEFGIERD